MGGANRAGAPAAHAFMALGKVGVACCLQRENQGSAFAADGFARWRSKGCADGAVRPFFRRGKAFLLLCRQSCAQLVRLYAWRAQQSPRRRGGGREQDRLEALQQCAMDGARSGACMAGRCSAAGAAHAKEMPKKQQLFRLCGVWRMGRGTAVPQARGSIVAHFIGGCVLLRGPAGPGLLLAIADTDSHVNQSGMGDVRGLCQFAPLAIGALAAMHPGWG